MMFLPLDGEGDLHAQVLRSFRQAILSRRLPAGSKLPSSRQLADQLGIARNTVVAAYQALCSQGLAAAKTGSGTYVTGARRAPEPRRLAPRLEPQSRYAGIMRSLPPVTLARRDEKLRLDLQYGEPMVDVALFTLWRKALVHAAQHTEPKGVAAQGLPALRREIAAHLARRRGIRCSADDVIVMAGTQQAISLSARVLLDPGDAVALEDPHYQLATQALTAHGARVHHVPVDTEGLDAALLPAGRLKLVYVTPSHQFPSGRVMSLPRRHRLLEEAAKRELWIFEDDYDGEFSFDGLRLPALRSLDARDRVVYVGTFTKTLLPSIRLGYVVAPAAIRQDLVKAKMLADLSCSAVEQTAVAHLLATGAYERHLRRTSTELKRRRRALVTGLRDHCAPLLEVEDTGGGMHVIGWLPRFDEARLDALVRLATLRGLGLHSVGPHHAASPARQGLLLGFAALSVTQLKAASELLGRCLADVAAAHGTRPGADESRQPCYSPHTSRRV